MKRKVDEIVASTFDEHWGMEVIDSSLLLDLEWGEVGRARRALEKIREKVVLDTEEEEAVKAVIALLSKLE